MSGAFGDGLRRYTQQVRTRHRAIFVTTATEALRSIRDGSSLTGSPGQPVDTGTLRASWHLAFETPHRAAITTNVSYAPIVEDNPRGARFRVGGAHSVKLTRAGLARIVEAVRAQVRGGEGA